MIRVYESDGSDGYSEGCWGVVVTVRDPELGDLQSSDGGFASREHASERGEQLESGMLDSFPGAAP